MAATFATSFLLPLVRGGRLHVGRPLGPRAVERLGRLEGEPGAAFELAHARGAVAGQFLADAQLAPPPLDEATLRLGAAVHDLLVLVHPDLEGPRIVRRRERIAKAACALASLSAPRSAREAVARHSLLARLPEIARTDSTVTFWLGRQVYVGRAPPPRVTALPGLRRVRVDVVRRSWSREIGVPAVAREAVLALGVASPLGEALDPLRLEPSLSLGRILPVLRWPALGRVVAGRLLEIGLPRAGEALAAAILRFASRQEPPGGVAATPESVAFALRFLAHLVWLDVLFAPESGREDAAQAPGAELAGLVTVAARMEPSLVWPRDVAPDGDAGRAFAARLALLAARARGVSGAEAAAGVIAFASPGADAGAAAARIHI